MLTLQLMIKLTNEGPKKKKPKELPSLHCATSLESMEIILKAAQDIPHSLMDMSKLACQTDGKGQTAVHVLSQNPTSLDALVYLIDELDYETIQNVLTRTDKESRTPLHVSTCSDITKLLIENIARKHRREYILAQDLQGNTAAHLTSQADIMEILLGSLKEFNGGEQNKLISVKNSKGNTPLHCARTPEVARAIVDALWDTGERLDPYVSEKNSRQQTIFHTASIAGRKEVIRYLKKVISYKTVNDLTKLTDDEGNTALHYAGYGQLAKILISAVHKNERKDFLFYRNSHGHTALDEATTEGLIGALVDAVPLEHRLEYISQCIASRKQFALPHTARSRCLGEYLDRLVKETKELLASKEAGSEVETNVNSHTSRCGIL